MKLKQLAQQIDGEMQGDPEVEIVGVATLENATAEHISFLANPKYREHLNHTKAAAVILDSTAAQHFSGNKIILEDPYYGFAQALQILYPETPLAAGVHATASVATDVKIPASVSIAANATILAGCVIGENCSIGAGTVVGEGVTMGENCKLHANVTLYSGVQLGDRVSIHSGSVIGADGFGYANKQGKWVKIPQVGTVIIGNDVEIGANTTVDRGAIDDTVIEAGVIIDNLVQIAHNVRIGANTAIAGCVGVAGSTKIGKYCAIGGGVGIVGHIEIVDGTIITAGSVVLKSIQQAGTYSSGAPLEENKSWRRIMVHVKNLDKYAKKIKDMAKTLDIRKGS